MKICTVCNDKKPINEFYKSKQSKDNHEHQCKKCRTKVIKKYRRTKNGLINTIYSSQKSHSEQRKMEPPKYSKSELSVWIKKNKEFEILYQEWVKSGYKKEKVPSVDRIDDYKQYELDNIRLMTWRDNYKKAHIDKKNGVNNKQNKKIEQYNKNGKLINIFHSQSEAERKTGISNSSISECSTGKRKTAGSYIWREGR